MEKHRFYPDFKNLWAKYLSTLLIALLLGSAVATVNAADDEDFESSAPILISEADSVKALTANPENWRGTLPGKSGEYFSPGARGDFYH